ncbi:MAG TPA: hypothetical protein VN408_03620, partial [Actinoplanes sp.]|nr:hypothetical protein [Actinoplanes sp.]
PIRSRALTFDDRTGDQPRVVDTLVAEPGPGQIRVRMTAAAVLLPPEVPAHVAALIGCSVTTGYGAVHHTVPVRGGDTIVVTGCGGAARPSSPPPPTPEPARSSPSTGHRPGWRPPGNWAPPTPSWPTAPRSSSP